MRDCPAAEGPGVYDCRGRLVTPGLIDCHTHLVFGGNRAREFEQRLGGASYEEIARAGGGIVSTVKATRMASEADLLADALTRVDALISEGVTLVEVKSGYGLDRETELKMLRVARAIPDHRWLAANAALEKELLDKTHEFEAAGNRQRAETDAFIDRRVECRNPGSDFVQPPQDRGFRYGQHGLLDRRRNIDVHLGGGLGKSGGYREEDRPSDGNQAASGLHQRRAAKRSRT